MVDYAVPKRAPKRSFLASFFETDERWRNSAAGGSPEQALPPVVRFRLEQPVSPPQAACIVKGAAARNLPR